MEANELMLNDWVELTNPINKGEKVQVTAIHEDGCISFKGGTTKRFRPIPLTEEILAKNGFAYIEKDYDADDNVKYTHAYLGADCLCDNVDLHIGINNNGVFCVRWMHSVIYGLQFVHELQHAFKLLYIKREIKL